MAPGQGGDGNALGHLDDGGVRESRPWRGFRLHKGSQISICTPRTLIDGEGRLCRIITPGKCASLRNRLAAIMTRNARAPRLGLAQRFHFRTLRPAHRGPDERSPLSPEIMSRSLVALAMVQLRGCASLRGSEILLHHHRKGRFKLLVGVPARSRWGHDLPVGFYVHHNNAFATRFRRRIILLKPQAFLLFAPSNRNWSVNTHRHWSVLGRN